MKIGVLGPFEVVVDGQLRPVPGSGERELLALLATDPGRTMSVARLIDDLWESELPSDPVNSLQVRVSRLRKVIGAAIVTQGQGYRLEVGPGDVDAVVFAERISQQRFEEALGLWRGPPFSEFAERAWARVEATRLSELRATAIEEHIDARLAGGEHAALVAQLSALVAANPLRERLRGQLMVALHGSGRMTEALDAYQDLRRRLRDERGLEPSLTLRRLEGAILRQDDAFFAGITAFKPPDQLPAPVDALIGRDVELEQVTASLARGRLITLVGPGGAGKTRVAIAAARAARDLHPHGCWFVPLAGITDPNQVPKAAATALGLTDSESAPDRLVSAWLASRHALVVLDNCEHLADAAARFAERLLGAAPHVTIIATSREPLGVHGEIQMPIPPLTTEAAVVLFADRAGRIRPQFTLEGVEDDVRNVCQQLDNMPLAIELAAARTQALSVAEIAQRLGDRFALLSAGHRTAEKRHRTLWATVDWSYQLLDADERTMLRHLAVFRGGWTLEAVEAVESEAGAGAVLDRLGRLIDRSLVVVDGGRFTMLETIRAFAQFHLEQAQEEDSTRRRHARYYAELAERGEPALRGPEQSTWFARLRIEEANFQRALDWARQDPDDDQDTVLRLAASLGWYWYVGRQAEGHRLLHAALAGSSGGSAVVRGKALQALAIIARPAACIVHASAEAAEAAAESLTLLTEGRDLRAAALSRVLLAVEGVVAGDVDPFLQEVDAAREVLRAHGDAWGVALADFVEMEVRLHGGPVADALAVGERAAAAFDELDDAWGRSAVRLHMGYGLRLAGRLDEAITVLERAAAVTREAGLPGNDARLMVELGEAAARQGRSDDALRWLDQADEIACELASDSLGALALLTRGDVARWRQESKLARRCYSEALDLCGTPDTPEIAARARIGLAAVAIDENLGDEAAPALRIALQTAQTLGDVGLTALALEQLAREAAQRSDATRSADWLLDASLLREQHRRARGVLEERDVAEAA